MLFRFEKNIWKECEQDNILNLRSWFNTSVPWWNTAMSIWRLNSCKTQAWNDNSNTLILDTYNWPIKVLVKPRKLSCKTILKGRFRLIRTSGRKNSHKNSYNSAMSLISQLELGPPVFNLHLTCILCWQLHKIPLTNWKWFQYYKINISLT